MRRSLPVVVAVVGVVLFAMSGCTSKDAGGARVAVSATDSACDLSTTTIASGPTTFAVTNKGSDVTEVYVYADGNRVMGEVENIGPGTSRSFTVDLGSGGYEVACKPGQKGDGIRTSITVTGTATTLAAPDRTVDLTSYDYDYTGLDFFVAKEGETVRFVMKNQGTLDHEMEVLDGEGEPMGEIGPTGPGATGEVTVTFAEPGEWSVQCGIEDHLEHGMRRTFTVTS